MTHETDAVSDPFADAAGENQDDRRRDDLDDVDGGKGGEVKVFFGLQSFRVVEEQVLSAAPAPSPAVFESVAQHGLPSAFRLSGDSIRVFLLSALYFDASR